MTPNLLLLADVINVSGHRLGTAEIESALVGDRACAEAAVVGAPDDLTGYVCSTCDGDQAAS